MVDRPGLAAIAIPSLIVLTLLLCARLSPADTLGSGVGRAESAVAEASNPGELLDLPDGRIWYESRGDGPALVFIHDGLAHSEIWDAQVADLSRDYRVIRYDRRGYGRSPQPQGPYSNVADLSALVAHLDLGQVVLIGSSAGGGLVLDYALEHSERVAALVLVGPVVSGLGYSSHFNTRGMRNYDSEMDARRARWIADRWIIAPGNTAARDRLRELLTAFPNDLDSQKHRSHQAPPAAALPRLGEIRVPTLLVTGEADIPDVHVHVGAIEAAIPGARRVVLENAGHLCYLERPEVFNAMLREFFSLITLEASQEDEPPWDTFRRGFASTGTADIYYETMGSGATLVLMHGGLIDHRMWDPQFARLAESFRVVRYDSSGHGLTRTTGPGGTTYEELAALLDHLGAERAHLMGLSLGGRIAADFAIAFPERTGKVVLVSPGLSGYQFDSPEAQASSAAITKAWIAADWGGVVDAFMAAWTVGPGRESAQVDPGVLALVRQMGASPVRIQLGGGQLPELDPPAVGRLAEIGAPTLALLGKEDMPSIHEIVGMVQDQVPGARTVVFPQAAHMINLEQPQRFIDEVLEHLLGS
jgi:pimeloyl-ACP methyl ester carboxylesterase